MARRPRFNAWWLAPLAVLASLGLTWCQRARVPTRADWKAATDFVRERLQPGDGVTWAPYHAGEGRLFLHGLPAFHLLDPATADLARWDRVWLLGAFGAGARDLPSGHRPIDRQVFGTVTVELVEVGGDRVVGDLYAELESARLTRRWKRDDRRDVCDFWDGRGWHCDLRRSPEATRECLGRPTARRLRDRRRDPHCGLDPWLHASRDVRVVGGGPRRCIWFHPRADATMSLEWPGAPAAEKLVVDYGFRDPVVTDHARPAPRVKPARLTVRRGDAVLAEQVVPVEKGWHRLVVPLEGAGAAAGPMTFSIDTASTIDAHFCFDPTLRVARRDDAS